MTQSLSYHGSKTRTPTQSLSPRSVSRARVWCVCCRPFSDASCQRHIYSFTASAPFLVPSALVDPSAKASEAERAADSLAEAVKQATANQPSEASEASGAASGAAGEAAPFEGSEWVLLEVVGQSFLLHQIRKMVATAADLARRRPGPPVDKRSTQDAPQDAPQDAGQDAGQDAPQDAGQDAGQAVGEETAAILARTLGSSKVSSQALLLDKCLTSA